MLTSGCSHAGYDFSGIAGASVIIQGDGDPRKQGTALLPCSGRIVLGEGATAVVRGVRISGATTSAIWIGARSTVYAPMPLFNTCFRGSVRELTRGGDSLEMKGLGARGRCDS